MLAAAKRKKEEQRRAKVKNQRWHQLNAIWDTSSYRHPFDTLVLAYLFRYADKLGRVDASVRQIGKQLNIATSTAQRIVNRLRSSGCIKLLRKGSYKTANSYQIDYAKLYDEPSGCTATRYRGVPTDDV